jgi:hypothetical protein
MPDYTENARRWAEKVEIDYFTQFIKAWIPFNAWFQNSFEDDRERQIINALKTGTGNPLKSRIVRLLEQDDEEAADFKNHLSRLHYHLERHDLRNRGERLTFTRCFVADNSTNQITNERGYNGTLYTVERGIGRALQQNQRQSNIFCEITSNRGVIRYTKLQSRHDWREVEEDDAFIALRHDEKSGLLERYERVNPRLMLNLLDTSNNRVAVGLGRNHPRTIAIGAFRFCDNPEYIFSGLVEVLYSLRCLLFHGELIPTTEMNAVYEPAYFILRRFLTATT